MRPPSPNALVPHRTAHASPSFAFGDPIEAVYWVTAGGIWPGVNSVTLGDSDGIARAVLALFPLSQPAHDSGWGGPPAPLVGKARAKALLADASIEADRTGRSLTGALGTVPEIAAHLDGEALAVLVVPADYTGAVGPLVDRALKRRS